MATAAASKEKLYKIGEVCKLAELQPYVLRYWETEFPQLSPNKSGGGQRLYTQRELDIILRIKDLLYREGFTIAGAKKKLETEGAEGVAAPIPEPPPMRAKSKDATKKALLQVKKELTEILRMLDE